MLSETIIASIENFHEEFRNIATEIKSTSIQNQGVEHNYYTCKK